MPDLIQYSKYINSILSNLVKEKRKPTQNVIFKHKLVSDILHTLFLKRNLNATHIINFFVTFILRTIHGQNVTWVTVTWVTALPAPLVKTMCQLFYKLYPKIVSLIYFFEMDIINFHKSLVWGHFSLMSTFHFIHVQIM